MRKSPADIKKGVKFGDWVVISDETIPMIINGRNYRERLWLCRCKCGTEKRLRTTHLTGELSKQCQDCHNRDRGQRIGDIHLSVIRRIKEGAIKRQFEYNLTNGALWDLFLKQDKKCALSGVKLIFSHWTVGSVKGRKETTASLDRIDSTKGYIKGNVQWILKDINLMKMHLDQDLFIKYCKLIANNN